MTITDVPPIIPEEAPYPQNRTPQNRKELVTDTMGAGSLLHPHGHGTLDSDIKNAIGKENGTGSADENGK